LMADMMSLETTFVLFRRNGCDDEVGRKLERMQIHSHVKL